MSFEKEDYNLWEEYVNNPQQLIKSGNIMKKNQLLFLLLSLFIPTVFLCLGSNSAVYAAAPTINSVSGTVATGQTLNISGSNMVNESNANWRPMFKTSAYSFEGSSPSSDGYLNGGGTYDSSVKLLGSKSIRFHVSGASSNCPSDNLGDYVYTNEAGQTDYWVRGYVRYESKNNLWASSHLKMFDEQDGTPPNTYIQWTPGSTMPSSLRITKDMSASNVDSALPSGTLQNDRWYLVEIHTQPSQVTVWIDNTQVVSTSKTSNNLDYFNLGVVNTCGTSSSFDLYNWMDGVTISSSRVYAASMVEISGDGKTWKYQEPVSLGETSSQIKLNLAGLTGTNYQLRVTNNQQQTSNIYSLSGGAAPPPPVEPAGDTQSPTTPSNLTASAVSSSQINLSWSKSTDNTAVTGYKIYRSGTYIATSTATSYTNTGLAAATSYSYKVSAIDAAGNESSQCSSVSATTQAVATSGSGTTSGSTATSGSGTTSGSTAPSGGTVLFQESFDNNSFSSRGWYDNTNHGTIVSGGQSGNALQWSWAQGASQPTNGASMRMQFTPTDTLYMSYYVKFQTGWKGSQQSYHPHMIYVLSDVDNAANAYSPLANNYLNTYVEFVSDTTSPYAIRPVLALQDEKRVNTSNGSLPNNLTSVTENRSVAYCNTPAPSGATGMCYADDPYYSANTWRASTNSVSTNSWHRVEVYFKMNTISGGKGQANGIMQEWIDGNLVINQSNVLYRTNQDATKKWAQFVLAPYIGDGSPIAQSMWLDELTVSTAAPGGTTQPPATTTPSSGTATSLWNGSATPATPAANDTAAVELGVKFQSSAAGFINGLRFYKGTGNTGTHTGSLWTTTGQLLATATFTNETASGWQYQAFSSPVAIAANTTYVASYHTNVGRYSADLNYFAGSGYTNSPLRTLGDGENGGNGVYLYGAGGFPNQTYNATNYWVDVVFAPNTSSSSGSTTQPPTTTTPPATTTPPVVTDTATPSRPTGLSASAVSSSQINLSWTASTDNVAVTGYKIYRGGSYLATSTSASYTNTGLTASTSYSYNVSAIDAAGNESSQSSSASATTEAVAATPSSGTATSLWNGSITPAITAANDTAAVELGVKFQSSADGFINGLRFYKGTGNTGTHTGSLWTTSGQLLATVTFTNETASGWQYQAFSAPVAITANTTYVASYHTNAGRYSADLNYFAGSGYTNSPLRTLGDGENGGNGVYLYGAGGFPNQTYNATNYWVDVVFTGTAGSTTDTSVPRIWRIYSR